MKSPKKIALFIFLIITIINITFIKTHMMENKFEFFLNNKQVKVTINPNYDAFSKEYAKQDGKSMYNNSYTDYETLLNDSDLVAIVKPISYYQSNKTVLTTVDIQKVIKGSFDKETKISIYEPYYFYSNFYMTDFYFSPMRIPNRYMVFLKKEPKLGDKIYNFTSNVYAKFPCKSDLNIFYADEVSTLKQGDILNTDLIIFPDITYMDKKTREEKCLKERSSCNLDVSDKTMVNLYNSYKTNYINIFNHVKHMWSK